MATNIGLLVGNRRLQTIRTVGKGPAVDQWDRKKNLDWQDLTTKN